MTCLIVSFYFASLLDSTDLLRVLKRNKWGKFPNYKHFFIFMQKAIIVKNCVVELNDYLKDGWTVVNSCAMPSSYSSGYIPPTCLVIIEKKD